jgi:hypothetical protein
VLTHAPRQPGSWLTWDVGQNMKLFALILFLLCSAVASAGDLSLRIESNASAIRWTEEEQRTSVLVIDVFVENKSNGDLTVLTAPKRVLNWNSCKAIYWFDVEGLGGQVIVPNPYVLRPVRLPQGKLALIDKIEIPISELPKDMTSGKHIVFDVAYEIDPAVVPYLTVWTGKISGQISIK